MIVYSIKSQEAKRTSNMLKVIDLESQTFAQLCLFSVCPPNNI